jgi:hypothetical protein
MTETVCAHILSEYLKLLDDGAPEKDLAKARRGLEACLDRYAPAVTQAVIEQMEMLSSCMQAGGSMWECLGITTIRSGKVVPIPGYCPERTEALRSEVFEDVEKVMTISIGLQDAFEKAGVSFDEDETFVCTIAVAKRPRYVSDILEPYEASPLGRPGTKVNFVMEPGVMKPVMEAIARDRID